MAFYDKNPRYNALREKAIELALKNLEHPDSPGWKTQMCCMPGVGKIWQWDSCFMALYALDLPGVIEPMNNLDNLYLCQREDGFMAMAYIIETRQPAFGELINPPLFAWVPRARAGKQSVIRFIQSRCTGWNIVNPRSVAKNIESTSERLDARRN